MTLLAELISSGERSSFPNIYSLSELKKKNSVCFIYCLCFKTDEEKFLNVILPMRETCTGSRWRQRNKGEQGCTHPMRPRTRPGHDLLSPELPEAPRASSASPALSACALLLRLTSSCRRHPLTLRTQLPAWHFCPGSLSPALACTEISQRACSRLLGASSLVFHSAGLQWSPRSCLSHEFPGNAEAAGLGPHCWDPLLLWCPTNTHSLDKDKVLPLNYKAMQFWPLPSFLGLSNNILSWASKLLLQGPSPSFFKGDILPAATATHTCSTISPPFPTCISKVLFV